MSDRDRLIELINDSELCSSCERLADHLIANGVIAPPCKVGDYVRFKGLTSLWRVDAIHFYREGMPQITVTLGKKTNTITYFGDEFEVFTKEEAEQALKVGEGNEST